MHIKLHLICSVVCCTLPCHASLNRTCIIVDCASCHVHVVVVYYVIFSFPVLLLQVSSINVAFVRIRSNYARLSSSWTRSSSLRDLRQDDRYPGSHYYHCYASCFVLSLCCATYHLLFKPPKLPCQPLTLSPFLANHCLAMLPLLLSPSYSVVSCR